MQIHELPEAASAADTDQIAIDTGTNTKKFSILGLLRKIIGTTSISGIGDGTVTGAISALKSDSSYVSGETVAIARVYCAGYIDNTNKLHFFVPLSKEKILNSPTISSINISTLYLIHSDEVVSGASLVTAKTGFTRVNGADLELTVSSKPTNITYYEPLVIDFRGSFVF